MTNETAPERIWLNPRMKNLNDSYCLSYAGIGSRETPEDILKAMESAARFLGSWGYLLRSGGAKGADSAFERGCDQVEGSKHIFLPWKGFNKNQSPLWGTTKEARLLAKKYHPNWNNVSDRGRDFHARNCYQILGATLDKPCNFVLCWTPNGKPVGGTGQALRIAKDYGIEIINFGSMSLEQISDRIQELTE